MLNCLNMLSLLLTMFALSLCATSSSFYDNPEQDEIPVPERDTGEELHRKWDFEVLWFQHCLLDFLV